ncbi:ubiquitin-conjugating enzyme E2-22 kDa-like isoform X1 [Dinothrombium tinctorium]|uniref:Ubiquitin-conjugating enzyme E2-22 kDa-like isoform X1 n=1 Tax=Dinothrombium tinctorium TaxID=1965070 RepID=A0A3S3PI43_9ACAR|nr:ubiquitin-conjugating enzyme E2-22 kDa-like isoform X1 [Dinothrombium tinctorium]RWS01660.1 ubiquitin-conjugating enzyme E2-22 kDa-like isoform X1 [Dinothrombium tinctorium]
MAVFARKRLKHELMEFEKSDQKIKDSISIELVHNNLFNLKLSLKGPPDTPYFGGKFYLSYRASDNYPFSPPSVQFTTRIWHPNISSVTGFICLDILKEKWEASYTIISLLISVQVLLQDPQPNDPQDAVVAKQYLTNRKQFNDTAAYWTAIYAMNQSKRHQFPEFESKLKTLSKLVEGSNFAEDKLISALSGNDWDVNRAFNALF